MQAQDTAPGCLPDPYTNMGSHRNDLCRQLLAKEVFPKHFISAFRRTETDIAPTELIIKGLGPPCYPPFTQSSSHLSPPGRLDQEKSSADLLQTYATILWHSFRFDYQYLNIMKQNGCGANPREVPLANSSPDF